MFNQQKNITEFEQSLLVSKLIICAEEAAFPSESLPYIKSCIKTFVASLTDYDYGYVSRLNQRQLEDLLALIKEPKALLFLINHELNLHWIFGSSLTLCGENEDVQNRIKQYNAPWGREITLQLALTLTDTAIAYFVNNDIISFKDLHTWDKASEKGIDFVQEVLQFLTVNARKVQQLLENNTFTKTSLQTYLLENGTAGLLPT